MNPIKPTLARAAAAVFFTCATPAIAKEPAELDCGRWPDAAKAGGLKYAVLTVKHAGGFPLWDSNHTTHDFTAFKNHKDGKGDIVRDRLGSAIEE